MNKLIRFIPSAVGALLICFCTPLIAQSPFPACQVEIDQAKSAWGAGRASSSIEDIIQEYSFDRCTRDREKLKRFMDDIEKGLRDRGNNEARMAALHRMNVCIIRALPNQCAAAPTPSRTDGSRPNPPAGGNPSGNSPNTPASQLADAINLANKRQADVDRARQGKPKRHVVAREAHNCLKPQIGGGVINNCPYAVEYSYCVLRPEPNSWSESFTCGKNIGSWQIGAGPNTRAIMHTAGQATYWFACRSGDSLSKPDGVSPVDIEYQAGRGLLGRCAEWGSGGK